MLATLKLTQSNENARPSFIYRAPHNVRVSFPIITQAQAQKAIAPRIKPTRRVR